MKVKTEAEAAAQHEGGHIEALLVVGEPAHVLLQLEPVHHDADQRPY